MIYPFCRMFAAAVVVVTFSCVTLSYSYSSLFCGRLFSGAETNTKSYTISLAETTVFRLCHLAD